MESFLVGLRQRGCNFHIVWFRSHEHLCVPESVSGDATFNCYRLTRAILVKHLKHFAQHAPEPADAPPVFEFDSVDSDAFRHYLAHNAVHFFLCLDGCALDGRSSSTGVQYLEFLHNMAFRGYSIALMNDLEFASSKVVYSPLSTLTTSAYPISPTARFSYRLSLPLPAAKNYGLKSRCHVPEHLPRPFPSSRLPRASSLGTGLLGPMGSLSR